ncbi:hypothetical protein MCEMSEM23_00677 [Rhabdaerophilaceae bacterium]
MNEGLGRQLSTLATVAIAAAGTVLAAYYLFGLSSLPVSANFQDWLTMLDGAARLEAGQRPHVGFQSLIGPATYWMASKANQINPGAGAFLAMHAFALVLALPAALLIIRHSDGWARALALLLFTIAMLAPFNLDAGPACVLNYNGTYNRWGTGLLLAMAVALSSVREWGRADYVLAGLVILLALALKSTIGIAAALMIGIGMLAGRLEIRPVVSIGGILFGILLLIDLTSGMVRGHISDLLGVWQMNQAAERSLLLVGVAKYVVELSLVVVALAGLSRFQDGHLRHLWWKLALVGAIFFSDIYSYGGLPLIACLGVCLAQRKAVYAAPSTLLIATLAAAGTVLLLPLAKILAFNPACLAKNALSATDLRTIDLPGSTLAGFKAHRIYLDAQPGNDEMRLRGSTLGDEAFHRDPAAQVFALRSAADAARALARRYPQSPGHRTLDFADPFPAMLGWVPPPGAPVTLHMGRTIGAGSFPPPDAFFAGIRVVLVPTCSLFQENRALVGLYRDAMTRDFIREQLTPCWDVHARKAAP